MLAAYGPEKVYLNRGNHEDVTLCRVYGFEAECLNKYDTLVFEMCCEVFNYLPLFTGMHIYDYLHYHHYNYYNAYFTVLFY